MESEFRAMPLHVLQAKMRITGSDWNGASSGNVTVREGTVLATATKDWADRLCQQGL